ncbi:MAG TPA: glycosyltransferase, partial [Patescibacteria group bacterium]|nr:glycosyltransferase [Patescibacteria group bacterium]
MATRAAAAAVLVVTALVAWATITIPLAARVLQVSVVASMLYVAFLAWRGSRAMRRAIEGGIGSAPPSEADPRPFVSLVLPARNEAAVIAATVRALADQRYGAADGTHDFELLVVDDASTDATEQIAREAAGASPQVAVVRREAPAGPRTKGAVLA